MNVETLRLFACAYYQRDRENPLREDVVVAGGGMVLADDAEDVERKRPEIAAPAAHAKSVAAHPALLAAEGRVVSDAAVVDRGARAGLNGEAAPQPVAARAASATTMSTSPRVNGPRNSRGIADPGPKV
jgi:hypothetical protein